MRDATPQDVLEGRARWCVVTADCLEVLPNGFDAMPLDSRQFAPVASERVEEHPCPKPLAPFSWLVESLTEAGQVVLDPFCGSGTTGVACLRLGRRFIGIEKDPTYAEVARDRLEAESRGQSLREFRAGQQTLFGEDK